MSASTPITTVRDIQIVPVKPEQGLIGFASFVVDDRWYIGSVAIYTRLDGQGIRLVYPKKNLIDCVHPVNRSIGEAVTKAVQEKLTELYSSFQDVYEPRSSQSAQG